MSRDYSRSVQTALRMIYKSGRNIEVTTIGTGGEYDPATGTFLPSTDDKYQIKGVFTNFDIKEIDGTNVLHTDQKVLIAAGSLPIMPKSGDTIKDSGAEYAVVNTNSIKPGDTAILYEVQIRR